MKAKFFWILSVFVLILTMLACGSEGPSVNAPSEEEVEVIEDQPTAEEVTAEDIPTEEKPTEDAPIEEEPTEEKAVGSARSNPAPVGSDVVADNMAFKILSIIRPADDIVMQGNMFNTEPESGQEYLLVELQITCQKSSDEECSLSSFWNFSVIGSSGVKHDAEFIVTGVEGLLESVDFYGDTTVSGYVPFIVGQEETDLIFVYEPLLFGDTFYLALPNQ